MTSSISWVRRRYVRRLQISQKRILDVAPEKVVYQSKDTRTKKTLLEARARPLSLSRCSRSTSGPLAGLDALLRPVAPDKPTTSATVFLLLGRSSDPTAPAELRITLSSRFQVDPLCDSQGQMMSWVRHIRATVI